MDVFPIHTTLFCVLCCCCRTTFFSQKNNNSSRRCFSFHCFLRLPHLLFLHLHHRWYFCDFPSTQMILSYGGGEDRLKIRTSYFRGQCVAQIIRSYSLITLLHALAVAIQNQVDSEQQSAPSSGNLVCCRFQCVVCILSSVSGPRFPVVYFRCTVVAHSCVGIRSGSPLAAGAVPSIRNQTSSDAHHYWRSTHLLLFSLRFWDGLIWTR